MCFLWALRFFYTASLEDQRRRNQRHQRMRPDHSQEEAADEQISVLVATGTKVVSPKAICTTFCNSQSRPLNLNIVGIRI